MGGKGRERKEDGRVRGSKGGRNGGRKEKRKKRRVERVTPLYFHETCVTSIPSHLSHYYSLTCHTITPSPPHREERERFIRAKYIEKEFVADLPPSNKSITEVCEGV